MQIMYEIIKRKSVEKSFYTKGVERWVDNSILTPGIFSFEQWEKKKRKKKWIQLESKTQPGTTMLVKGLWLTFSYVAVTETS